MGVEILAFHAQLPESTAPRSIALMSLRPRSTLPMIRSSLLNLERVLVGSCAMRSNKSVITSPLGGGHILMRAFLFNPPTYALIKDSVGE